MGLYQITDITDFLIRNQYDRRKITDITDVTVVTDLIKKRHWQDHGWMFEAHISNNSLFSSQDHGRLPAEHISKHSEKDSR